MNHELVLFLSPFLPRRADHFPRFRDIFLGADDSAIKGDIYIYTRMGGGNRECWGDCPNKEDGSLCPACDADALENDERCVHRYDDDFDCTYSTFVFRVSDDDRADFDAVVNGGEKSERYVAAVETILADIKRKQAEKQKESKDAV
jgi:hypothetical protein